jgi:hypothetical protein
LGQAPQVYFAASQIDVSVPALLGTLPITQTEGLYSLFSAPMRDRTGAILGFLNFDVRFLTYAAAEAELSQSALWNHEAAESYAERIGRAMVTPIVANLQTFKVALGYESGSPEPAM